VAEKIQKKVLHSWDGMWCRHCGWRYDRVPSVWCHIVTHDMPRFHVFLTMAARHSVNYRYVNVVELKPRSKHLPVSIRSREVKQVLWRSITPLRITASTVEYGYLDLSSAGPAIEMFAHAKNVIEKLDRMNLSLQVADLEDELGLEGKGDRTSLRGVAELFNHLWSEELNVQSSDVSAA
jgi:hypothetical protein